MKQNGFTLVELMVGLVVSMLCMIMMLMLFKQVSQISMSSSQDAEYDAQLQTGLLVAQRFIQNAGYGSGQANDIYVGTQFGNPAVFWRMVSNLSSSPVSYSCQGIGEKVTTEGKFKIHRLVLLKKTACGTSEAIQSGTWEEDQSIMAIKNQNDSATFQYTLISNACRPFGIDKNTSGSKQLTLTAPRQNMTGLGNSVETSICLSNIKST